MHFRPFFRRVLALRDDPVMLAACFAPCNNLYLEAQRVGNNPAICASTSTFSIYKKACDACLLANPASNSTPVYFQPLLQDIVRFCTTSITPEAFSSRLSVASVELASMSRAVDELERMTKATSTVTQTFTPTILTLAPTLSSNASSTPKPIPKQSQAWIAGAVIGPLFLLSSIIAFAIIFMRRRKHKEKTGTLMEIDTEKKDGDPKSELHAESKKVDIHEMQSEYEPVELPAREAVGAELTPTSKAKEFVRKPVTAT